MTFQVVRFRRDEYACLCPWHADKSPSLFINLEKDKAICFAGCYKGTARDAIRRLLGFLPQNLADAFSRRDTIDITYTPRAPTLGNPEYMYRRGFTAETLKSWEISYDPARQQIVIPVRKRTGEQVGSIYRQTIPDAQPKYLYSEGFRVSKVLFGTQKLSTIPVPYVCLVEGPLDCLWLWQNGWNSVALLGASLSNVQKTLLSRVSPRVLLCLDSDAPGQKATRRIGGILVKTGFDDVSVVTLLPGKKDIQEHSVAELRLVISEAQPFLTWRLHKLG